MTATGTTNTITTGTQQHRRRRLPLSFCCCYFLILQLFVTIPVVRADDRLDDHTGDNPEDGNAIPSSPIWPIAPAFVTSSPTLAPTFRPTPSPTQQPSLSPSSAPTSAPLQSTIFNAFILAGPTNLLNNAAIQEKVEEAYALLIQDILNNNRRQRALSRRLEFTNVAPGSIQIYNIVQTSCDDSASTTSPSTNCYIFYGSFGGIFSGDNLNLPALEAALMQAIRNSNFQDYLDVVNAPSSLVFVGVPPGPHTPQQLTAVPTTGPTATPTRSPTQSPESKQDTADKIEDSDENQDQDNDTSVGGGGENSIPVTTVAVAGAVALSLAFVVLFGSRRLKRRAETGAFPDFQKELAASQAHDDDASSSTHSNNPNDDEDDNNVNNIDARDEEIVSDSSSEMDVAQMLSPHITGAFDEHPFLQFLPSRIEEEDEEKDAEKIIVAV